MTAPDPSRVSVCLLTYNGRRFLDGCVAALQRLDPAPIEIVAVDNASRDGSAERLDELAAAAPRVPIRVVRAPVNRGYGAGHNLGARAARGDYLAFLNVTVVPEPGWLAVGEWLEGEPRVAFVQPAIFRSDDRHRLESLGSLLHPCGDLTVVGRNEVEPAPPGPPYVADVFSVLGAAFVARRTAFEVLGGFDERLFMYFEETDLCWRGWLRGWRSACWFDPSRPTRVVHTTHGTHPAGFDVASRFEPNRTLTLVRNLGRQNLWRVGQNVVTVASETARRPRALVRYGASVARGLPAALRDRRTRQSTRTVDDATVFGLAPPPGRALRSSADRPGPP